MFSILSQRDYTWLNQDDYVNAASIIKFQCNKCGHIAHANISNILSGRACRGCSPYKKKTTLDFAQIVANTDDTDDGYELLSEYKTCKDKVTLKHRLCGRIFEMTPDGFVGGSRCPHCATSHGELEIKHYLDDKGIAYVQQYRFGDCRNIKPLPFDFYLPELNVCIEYNGQQHYCSVNYFGGEDGYARRKKNDEIKRRYCKENGISLIIIPYWEFTQIGGVINDLATEAR